MITQVSDRERQLESEVMHLGELLKAANKECNSLKEDLHDERNRGLALLEDAKEVQAERDELKAELGQAPEIQAMLMKENKELRTAARLGLDALEPYLTWEDGTTDVDVLDAITTLRGVLGEKG